jgi:hypothetical protein
MEDTPSPGQYVAAYAFTQEPEPWEASEKAGRAKLRLLDIGCLASTIYKVDGQRLTEYLKANLSEKDPLYKLLGDEGEYVHIWRGSKEDWPQDDH